MERKFKDSGIDWIQKIPETWEVGQLKRLLSFNNGQDYKHIESDSGYPVYGSGGVFMHASQYLYDGEAVLFGRKGTINKPLYVNDKFWTVDTMYYALPKEDCIAKYIYYMAILFPYDKYQTSTALPSMTQSILGNLNVCIPQKDEQQRIANYLDEKCGEIDSLIALQEQMIEKLKAYKQSVITEAVTKGLDPNANFVPSGVDWIGKIPERWDLIRLKFLCTIQTGNQDTQDADKDGEYLFYVRSPQIERSHKYTFEGEGILMAGDGAGAGRVFHHAYGKYAVHQRVYRLANFHGIDTNYLFYFISSTFCKEMDRGSAQSTVPSVRLPMLTNFTICIPSIKEQRSIAAYLDEKCADIDRLIALKQLKIESLKDYKKSVIYEAVTGKIDII
jgi:type I restriction enzyme S subunit